MVDLHAHADDECCMLTTIGRRTGRPHRIEIWFGVDNRAVYMISGNGPGADWFQNALADPNVVVEFGEDEADDESESFRGHATRVTDPDERHRIGELMGHKYPWGGDLSIGLTRQAWCFEVPLLRIVPTEI